MSNSTLTTEFTAPIESTGGSRLRVSRGEVFAVAVTIVYFSVALAGVMHHEMWNDEFQAWLIARDSTSLLDLLSNIRYEGSGPLWYLLLYPLTRLTRDPLSMQVLHVSIATACVYLVSKYSPFAWYQKLLVPFGYFFLFEYSMISRSYVVGNLLVFTFCIAYQSRRNYPVLFGILALLASTSAYSAILAIALGLGLLVDGWLAHKQDRATANTVDLNGLWRRHKLPLMVGLVSLLVAVTGCVLFMMPPRDGFKNDWQAYAAERISFQHPQALAELTRASGAVLYAYAPVPSLETYHFWETSIFRTDFHTLPAHWVFVSVGIFLSTLFCFRRLPFVAISYGVGTTAIFAFSYLIYTGAMRHFGQLFILLIACLWLARFCRQLPNVSFYPFDRATAFGGIALTVILAIQTATGVYCYAIDFDRPFARTDALVSFLRKKRWDKATIVSLGITGDGICALLDRSVYQYEKRRYGTFWKSQQWKSSGDFAVYEALNKTNPGRQSVLIFDRPMAPRFRRTVNVLYSKIFKGAIVSTQNRYLYIVTPKSEQEILSLKARGYSGDTRIKKSN